MQQLIELATTRFPAECRYMMRIWRASWRQARILSILALVVLLLPALAVGVFVGKQMNRVIITNIMPAPPSPSPGDGSTTDMVGILQNSMRILQNELSDARTKLAEAQKWIPLQERPRSNNGPTIVNSSIMGMKSGIKGDCTGMSLDSTEVIGKTEQGMDCAVKPPDIVAPSKKGTTK